MVDLNKDIKYIKGVGPNRATLLNKLGIYTLGDLITYFPREHEDRGKIKNISELVDGEEALIYAYPMAKLSQIKIRNNLNLCKLLVRDSSGTCEITWYNQPYLRNVFKTNVEYKFYGKVSKKFGGKADMQSPVYELAENSNNTGKIIPIYPLTFNLTQNSLRKIIENGLLEVNGKLEETLPQYLLAKYNLEDINTAISQIHFPEEFKDFERARKRLVFEELLSMQLSLIKLKDKYETNKPGIAFNKDVKMSDVINTLPFKLTKAQLRVLEEIDKNMESEKSINRLLQGDVGSRKNSCSNVCCIQSCKIRISSSNYGTNSNFGYTTFGKF